jgi:hypothetical protein
MRVIYRKIRHARYIYIKRNVEKVGGARYTLGARYLSKNTVIYFNNKPLHVLSRLAAHHQEDQLCINSNWCSQHNARHIPVAVHTGLMLLMMSSKPTRNM